LELGAWSLELGAWSLELGALRRGSSFLSLGQALKAQNDVKYYSPLRFGLFPNPVADITIEDVPLEDVIAELFAAQA